MTEFQAKDYVFVDSNGVEFISTPDQSMAFPITMILIICISAPFWLGLAFFISIPHTGSL